jgi:type IV pilus assembly protein PilV
MHTIIQRQRKQDGFTLLEVLIALLVLSIGLLGLAALQTIGLRSSQMANMRTVATQKAYDISDRMRANQAGLDAENYVQAVTDTVTVPEVNCITTACTPAQMATFDLASWLNEVIRLPGGRGGVARDASGTLVKHTITVFWDEDRKGAAGTGCDPDNAADLNCIQLTLK